ncbi:MAG: LytTR family DNA-binding domain-containing protein [Cyclobacteriaceae bacterium]|jgi:two-component system LytT family response regulator|nr:LytTR family DNA-binding domain-containing protein [Cyclobacteriaceae bacterium]
MRLKAVVIDDERPDRELLRSLLGTYCPSIEVTAEAESVALGQACIAKHKPEVVFLDIEMPTQTGFELFAQWPDRDFLTVMTTGYDQYGIKALKAGAFDYLLKPIDVDELVEVEQKLIKAMAGRNRELTATLYHQGEQQIIKLREIVLVQAQGSYTLVQLVSGAPLLMAKNMALLLDEFNYPKLQRVHRSFAINVDHLKSFKPEGNEARVTLTGNHQAPVSRTYKSWVKQLVS